jgi:hypothetical protein
MTSGQGGGPDQPPHQQPGQGQPPSAPFPPAPPPGGYAPAPPPPPPAYPGAAPGYGPAPSAPNAWGPGAPPAVERPVTVRAGLGLFIAEIVLGLIGAIYVLANSQDLLNRVRGQLSGNSAQLSDSALHAALVAGAVVGLIIVAVELLFIWFAWQGRNWARIVLWIVGGLGVVSGLAGLGTNSQFGGFYSALGVCQLLITIAAVVLLALKPSNEWYRYRRWLRATGQR